MFIHVPRCCIIVCRECGIGLVKARLKTHIDAHHKHLPVTVRKAVVEAARDIEDLAESEEDVVYPAPESEPVPGLAVRRDGWMCTASKADGSSCGWVFQQVKDMQKHCRKHHQRVSTRKRGRVRLGHNEGEADPMWVGGVCYQKFNRAGRLGRLFPVNATANREQAGEEGEEEGEAEDVAIKQRLEASFRETAKMLEEADREANARIEPDNNRYVTHAWLNRVGWARHLAGLDRDWLSAQIQRPKKSEKALARVC